MIKLNVSPALIKSDLIIDQQKEALKSRENLINEELKTALEELANAYKVIAEKNKDITDSINYAKRIQQALLPDKAVFFRYFPDSFVFYRSKDIVSGDFYWFEEYEDSIIVAVVDCTGHGVPGAFMSMIGHNLLNEIVNVKDITKPSEILNRLNQGVMKLLKQQNGCNDNNDGMDIGICFIDKKNLKMEFAGANRSLLLSSGGVIREVKGDKFPVGGLSIDNEKTFFNHNIYLKKDDKIYMFTDGFVDQFGGMVSKKLMTKRLRLLLHSIYKMSMVEQHYILEKYFDEWKGRAEQTDDVLMIGMSV